MFEHFGFKDVLSGLLKYKLIFFVIMVIFILMGGFLQYRQTKIIETSNQDNGSWTASAYFTVDDKTYNKANNTKDDSKEIELKRFAATYQSLLKSDLSNSYVYDKILKNIGIKEFLSKTNLDVAENNLSPTDIGKLVTCKVIENTSTINLVVTSKNKAISEQLLKYYSEYLTDNIQKSVKENTLTDLGSTTQNIASKSSKSSKSIIMAVVGGFVTYLLFVFTWTLLFPTINRKSDFEQYNVKVIADL